jgi:hypothetical protein
MSAASSVSESPSSVVTALAPLMIAVLTGFLVIGAALPVLPLHVHDGLGFGPVMVGVVAGCQFAASLVARIWSGHAADTRGPKLAVMVGLAGASISGLLYLFSMNDRIDEAYRVKYRGSPYLTRRPRLRGDGADYPAIPAAHRTVRSGNNGQTQTRPRTRSVGFIARRDGLWEIARYP